MTGFLLWIARTGAGFVAALLLAFTGDLAARVFNLSIGYPWAQSVHQNLHFISIGLGAGIGAYLSWMNLERRWYIVVGLAVMVLSGGVVGAYLARYYGPGVDPTYWWSRVALDTTIHLAAAALSTGVASALGLVDLFHTGAALRNRVKGITSGERAINRTTRSQ